VAIAYFTAMLFFGAMSHTFGPESFEKVEIKANKVKDGDDLIDEKELEESGADSSEYGGKWKGIKY